MKNRKFDIVYIVLCVCLFAAWSGIADADSNVNRAGKRADAIVTADYTHHELHEGNLHSSLRNATVASGGAVTILINTPISNLGVPHLFIRATSSGKARLEVYRSPTVSAVGTAMEENNRNDISTKTANVEVTHTPTVVSLGTLVPGWGDHMGSSQNIGGESRAENECMLKPETAYLINAVSEANGNKIAVKLIWYENGGDAP